MTKSNPHHLESRITQARKRWEGDTSDRDVITLSRVTRKANRTAARLARRAILEAYAYL
jgi:hypothetical protein